MPSAEPCGPPADIAARLTGYTDQLTRLGAIRTPAVEHAFRSVPRHEFLLSFYYAGRRFTRTAGVPAPPEFLDIAYSNSSLLTRPYRDGLPPSSSSSPSLMARILEAAQLRPGMRVLEIGAGTGYNTALVASITGAEVVGVEVNRDVAAEAAAAVRRTQLQAQIQIVPGDGYLGAPTPGGWDRIIVSCGIAGLSPHWLAQLADGGAVLAPIAHAGNHPIICATPAAGGALGRLVCWADFMSAAGPLRPATLFRHDPAIAITHTPLALSELTVPSMSPAQYQDLHCHLGCTDPAVTRCYSDDPDFDPARGHVAIHTAAATAWVQIDGQILAAGPPAVTAPLARRLHELVLDWHRDQRPAATSWSAHFALDPPLRPPLLLPSRWQATTT